MKKLLMTLVLSLFLISCISAYSLGEFEQGEVVSLRQVCDCSYVNVSSVYNPYGDLEVTGNITSGNGFTGDCINTTFVSGIATGCND